MKKLIRRIVTKARSMTGRKANMAEATQATSPALDQAAINQAVTAALATALPAAITAAIKPLNEAVAKLQAPPAADANDGKKGVTGALTREEMLTLLDERDSKRTKSAERDAFAAKHLSKLPKIYQSQLGNDPAKWDEEAKSLQAQFEADVKTQPNAEPDNKGGASRDGGTTAANQPVDKSKIDPVNRIAMGLKA